MPFVLQAGLYILLHWPERQNHRAPGATLDYAGTVRASVHAVNRMAPIVESQGEGSGCARIRDDPPGGGVPLGGRSAAKGRVVAEAQCAS